MAYTQPFSLWLSKCFYYLNWVKSVDHIYLAFSSSCIWFILHVHYLCAPTSCSYPVSIVCGFPCGSSVFYLSGVFFQVSLCPESPVFFPGSLWFHLIICDCTYSPCSWCLTSIFVLLVSFYVIESILDSSFCPNSSPYFQFNYFLWEICLEIIVHANPYLGFNLWWCHLHPTLHVKGGLSKPTLSLIYLLTIKFMINFIYYQ